MIILLPSNLLTPKLAEHEISFLVLSANDKKYMPLYLKCGNKSQRHNCSHPCRQTWSEPTTKVSVLEFSFFKSW